MAVVNRSTPAAVSAAQPVTAAVYFACLFLPWVNPFAGGPSTWAGPWLFSALCAALLFTLARPGMPARAIGSVLGGLAAWALVRTGVAPETMALAAACLLVWMVAAVAAGDDRDGSLARVAGAAWVAAAVLSTVAALLQYFGAADRFAPWIDASAAGEAFANLRQRNQFASLTAIGMAVLLCLPAAGRRRWAAAGAMVLLAVGNAATTSRTGVVEVVLLGVLTWWWSGIRSAPMRLWFVGLLAYIAAAVSLPVLAQDVIGLAQTPVWMRVTDADPCSGRVVLWSNVLHLIAQRPWLGWGWGELDYAHYMTLYGGLRFCDILDNAHNLPLHLAVELGIPASVAVCGVLAWAILRARPWGEQAAPRRMGWAVLVIVGTHSMLEYPLWYGPFQMALGLCLGLLWPARAADGVRRVLPRIASTVLGAAALAGAAYAAWDYQLASQIYLPEAQRMAGWRSDPLARLKHAWLFRGQVRFAELSLTPLTRRNAERTFERASALLHYSPEPRVIEKLIDSAVLLGRDEDARDQLIRFRAAFPQAYAEWKAQAIDGGRGNRADPH